MYKRLLLISALFLGGFALLAQNPQRFQGEIDKYAQEAAAVNNKKLALFTGSSSIRIWDDMAERFPKKNVVNRGFGGSSMSDLLYYTDDLIFKYSPSKIFIYEGDNDIASGKTPDQILADAKTILTQIREKLPKKVKVYFISAKPSVSRWNLKDKYVDFNKQLEAWTKTEANVDYIDVWTPMLQPSGEVMDDIFREDNLHMTSKGYDIWEKVIKKYL
ncbi:MULTISPECIES: SGNH/GDSL hydrolase family protein [unclassified Imperialibacter]|uniref:SGNH/GDSL hydrolase family protein n=1 Tax=unclassified Imperialibacter TaxID=2629706 RepID=UPI001257E926|nr:MULTISPECIES: SGNH/GDSL hydrolase family protein [unclassified Imperialibacter]CAD5251376.1 Lysophospholipase L1 [Imperialibacter sp. 89]CAD5284513.1 Lysophospholipase L1 [Imperialibacter sp. 75]VVT11233.1 Lysophospholipase L1 [Imperialibacter sp. EC-SDR9]